MAKKITVDPAKLTGSADKIDSSAAEYQKTYTKLYTEVTAMKTAWDGADNVAFTTRIEGFKDDFQLMYKLMIDYANFLRQSAKSYNATQDNIINQASKLVN